MAICPYYYNFFALLYNKDIVFGGLRHQSLIEYTIVHNHQFFGLNFRPEDVIG
jgi:hypothetical protein